MEAEKKKKRYGVKHANGYGSIRKLPGKTRRRPYQVIITIGWEEVEGRKKQIQKALGYYEKREEAVAALVDYNRNPYEVGAGLTFEEVYNQIDISRKSKSKIYALRAAYHRCEPICKMRIKEIRTPDLQPIADAMIDLSESSQNGVRILWSTIFAVGMEKDLIMKDYSKFVKWESDFISEKTPPFTPEQVNRFSDDMKILCFTGMRPNEFLDVKTSDIRDGFIYLNGTKTDAAVRIIPIHNKIAEIVNQRLTGVYLCEGINGRMTYDYFLVHRFYPEMQRLGITGHTIRDTRKTFATYARRSKLDETIIKRLIGHKVKDITNGVYAFDLIDVLKREIDMFEIV